MRLANTVTAAAAAVWAQSFRERELAIATTVPIVEAGQAQTVSLVDAYMAAKAQDAGEALQEKGLDPSRYTIATLRGKPARDVYGRPFGALGGRLEQGAEFAAAFGSARAMVTKLAATDLQLAQTHASHDWMAAETRVVGYRRVLGPGNNCELCIAASTRTYRREELLPIHENCGCSVTPLFGAEPVASIGTSVRTELDPELGPRLLADDWSGVGPRLLP